ncbi:MAG: ABC-2 family transporter protein [Gemmatimonadaceae bacterium]|nr:ABC-2 family transporter protein [Gemmatimonadaceae bacterium]
MSRSVARSSFATFRDQYAELMRSAFPVDLQYRASIAIWLIWGITEPIISLGIWWSIAAAGAVDGYTREAFARYFFGVALVNQATLSWDAWNIDRWIREGEMNYRLTRPIAPIHEAIADNIAYKGPTALIILSAWIVAAAFWPAVRIPFEPGRWALVIVAVALAAAIRFLNGYATGLLAFWTTRATALVELQFGLSLFLSGRIAPLSLLPPQVTRVSEFLWFPYVLSFPVELLTGSVTTMQQYVRGFAGQIIWLTIWLLLYLLVWRRGRRHYGAVGG